MTLVTCRKLPYRFLVVLALCLLMLTGHTLFAQGSSGVQGVADWQAKRAIEDYINRFVTAQKRYATGKLPNNQFSVRVKIEGLTRVYNKESGWIWVAQFSGAILPDVYDKDKVQSYAHAILKICADKNKDVQVVVNEGEGVWTMSQKTSILSQDLPEKPGNWKEWGGPGEPPEPPMELPTGDNPTTPPTLPTTRPNVQGDPEVQALAKRVREEKDPQEKARLTQEYYKLIQSKTQGP